jgi:hypothetical protein
MMAFGNGLDIVSARGQGTRISFTVPAVSSGELVLESEEVGS